VDIQTCTTGMQKVHRGLLVRIGSLSVPPSGEEL